jgi:hypothetical protein
MPRDPMHESCGCCFCESEKRRRWLLRQENEEWIPSVALRTAHRGGVPGWMHGLLLATLVVTLIVMAALAVPGVLR